VECEAGSEHGPRGQVGRHEPQAAQVGRQRGDRHRRRLYSPSCLCRKGRAVLSRLFELGEGTLGRLAEELLSNPRIAAAFAEALKRAMEAKGTVDRNIQTVLGLLNVPSRHDVSKLATKLEAIQGNLMNLNLKVDRLLAERAARQDRLRERRAAEEKKPRG
jgi:hypothetical protein